MKIIIIALMLVTLASCKETESPPPTSINNSALSSTVSTLDTSDYSIVYPKDWELDKSGLMNTKFLLIAPLENSLDSFRENVNLIIQDLGESSINLDQFTILALQQIKTMVTNGRVVENNRVQSKGWEVQRIVSTGDQGVYQLRYEQNCMVKDNKAYVLTFTCEQDHYEAYKDISSEILNSFVLK